MHSTGHGFGGVRGAGVERGEICSTSSECYRLLAARKGGGKIQFGGAN